MIRLPLSQLGEWDCSQKDMTKSIERQRNGCRSVKEEKYQACEKKIYSGREACGGSRKMEDNTEIIRTGGRTRPHAKSRGSLLSVLCFQELAPPPAL